MSKTAPKTTRRERPADGGVVWHDRFNAFECLGCNEFTERRKHSERTPEKLAEFREFLVMDHGECWEFGDPKMALDARKYRSERKRRALLRGEGSGARGQNGPLDCSGYLRGR